MESVKCPGGGRSLLVVYAVYLSDMGFWQKLTFFLCFLLCFSFSLIFLKLLEDFTYIMKSNRR